MQSLDNRFSRRTFAAAAAALSTRMLLRQPVTAEGAPVVEILPAPVRDSGSYTAYIPTACKAGPFFTYTCEFDSAWAILKTFGIDTTLEDQVALIKYDRRVEPYAEFTTNGIVVHGGDIGRAYSGDYTKNFLARTTGDGMRRVFTEFGLRVAHVNDRERMEQHLSLGRLIWIKGTVDFYDWEAVTWITPEGKTFPTVFGNDHAFVVMGYNQDVVVIRDVLGPTDTNWSRPYELEVPWERFLRCWGAQNYDGLSVWPDPSN
jgi:hypothetical protein